MPGSLMSEVYWWLPVTNERPSTLGCEWPAIVQLVGRSRSRLVGTVLVSFWPLVSLPNSSFLPGPGVNDLAVLPP